MWFVVPVADVLMTRCCLCVSQVPIEDISKSSKLLMEALGLRERYMVWSLQSYCPTTERFLRDAHAADPRADSATHAPTCAMDTTWRSIEGAGS